MKTYLSLAVLAMIVFASCKKENNPVNNSNTVPTRLQRYIVLDGQDTVGKFNFSYDSQYRIAESHKIFYENGVPSYDAVALFNYNGNDTLLAAVNYNIVDLSGAYPDDTYGEYFIYDGSGRLLTDTISTGTGSLGYHFTYFSDHFRVITNFQDTLDAQQNISGGNILNENDNIVGAFLSPFTVTIQNTFDNHPNPFYYTEVRRTLLYMPENFLQDEELPAFPNNPLTISEVTTGTPAHNDQTTFSYTYNANGYPVTAVINDVVNGDQFRAFYYY